ncbi:MAG: CARDB domain-containing protein, partial [Acidobacteriota bacterium]
MSPSRMIALSLLLWLLPGLSAGAAPSSTHTSPDGDSYRLDGEWDASRLKTTEPFSATYLGEFDHISVFDVVGNYDKTLAGALNVEARSAVAQELYRHQPDDADFLFVFTGFEFDTGGARAFHLMVRNDVEGIGVEPFDQSGVFGSAGKLRGTIDMAALSRYATQPLDPAFEDTLVVMTHELLHQWCCYTTASNGALLGLDGSHWSYLLDSDASVMYGSDWRANGDGTFTARATERFYSPLDLYLAGFYDEQEVAPFLLIDNPAIEPAQLPQNDVTVDGTARQLTVADVIASEGPRQLVAGTTPRAYRAAFLYLKRPEQPLLAVDLEAIDRLRRELALRFTLLTGGRGTLQVTPTGVTAGDPGEPGGTTGGAIRPAEAFDLSDALAWLRGRQEAEGFWQDDPGTRLRDTTIALATLRQLDAEFTRSDDAASWLSQRQEESTDYLARSGRSLAVLGLDAAAARGELATRQNADGGWGVATGHASDPLDTALALATTASEISAAAVDLAVQYLHDTQGADGGWSHVPGAPSRTGVTTAVLQTLAELDRAAPVQGAALGWLAAKQNGTDGGFGDSPSTVHDTASVLETVARFGAGGAVDRGAAEAFLRSRQGVDGSWDGSVYATARAVTGLEAFRLPDLVFQAPISVEPLEPRDGEAVTIRATVANAGSLPTEPVQTKLYEGDPPTGSPVAEATLAALQPGESTLLTLVWDSTDQLGSRLLTLQLDSENVVREIDEAGNTATVEVVVQAAPEGVDLAIASSEITVIPPAPTILPIELAVSAVVRNLGRTDATDVAVRLWLGEPVGNPLGEVLLPFLAQRSSAVANFTHLLTGGEPVAFTLEATSAAVEDDTANNSGTVEVTPTPSIDLEVTEADLAIAENPVVLGGVANFDVELRNRGTFDAPVTDVTFSIADGSSEQEIDRRAIGFTAGQVLQQSVAWVADQAGDFSLVVQVDAEGQLLEIDEGNNRAELAFTVTEFTQSDLEITLDPPAGEPRDGDRLELQATVINTGGVASPATLVRLFDGEPLPSSPVIAQATAPALAVGQTATVTLLWDTLGQAGNHLLTAVVDPDGTVPEIDEDDNAAQINLQVLPPPAGVELEVTAGDIAFDPILPSELPTSVTVTVGLRNLGSQAAAQARVVVWDGAPGSSNLIHDRRLDVAERTDASFTFTYLLTTPAASLTVVADPDDEWTEVDEANNQVIATLDTEPTFDLEVTPADLELLTSPALLDSVLEFRVTARNRGTRDLPQSATLRATVSDGTVSQEIQSQPIAVPAGGSLTVPVFWQASLSGALELRIELLANGFTETDASNNTATLAFAVDLEQPNLVVRGSNLVFVPDPAFEGNTVTIQATIENASPVAADAFDVVAYDGDPASGAPQVAGPVTVSAAGSSTQTVSLTWSSVPGVDRAVFVVVDPDDRIAELSEDDNLAIRELQVIGLPDPAISAASIGLTPAFPRPGDPVTATVDVANLGEQGATGLAVAIFDADPQAGGQLLAPEARIDLAAGGTASANFALTTDPASDELTVFAVVNGDGAVAERSAANNTASRSFSLQAGDFAVTSRYFSPNGDGVLDAIRFLFRLDAPTEVRVRAFDNRQRAIRVWDDLGTVASGEVEWDGRTDRGTIAIDGRYLLQVVDASETVLGEAAVVLDNNRSGLLQAADTVYEDVTNLTCGLPETAEATISGDEQWVYFLVTGRRTTPPPRPAIYRKSTRTLGLEGVHVYEDNELIPLRYVVAEDSSWIAWTEAPTSSSPTSERFRLWLARGDGNDPLQVGDIRSQDDRTPLTFDAGARHLLYIDGNDLIRVPVDDVTQQEVLFSGEGFLFHLSPDRQKLLIEHALNQDPLTILLDLETGSRTELATGPFTNFGAWSPDSRRLALSVFDFGLGLADIWILDREGNLETMLEPPTEQDLPSEALELLNHEVLVYDEYFGCTMDACRQGFSGRLRLNSWSSLGPEIAGAVVYGLGITTFVQQIVRFDVETGAMQTIGWSGDEFFALPNGVSVEPGTGVVSTGSGEDLERGSASAGGADPAPVVLKVGEDFLPSNPTVFWAPNDEALLLFDREDDFDFGAPAPSRSWAVHLGLPGALTSPPCDPNSDFDTCHFTSLINPDPDNLWSPVLRQVGLTRPPEPEFSPSGKLLLFRGLDESLEPGDDCFDGSEHDDYLLRSLMNLTADLRIRRSVDPTNVLLEGTAVDVNLASYLLEFTAASEPEAWKPISPPRTVPAFDELLQTWVPPGSGTWLVRLTVEDLAGNRRQIAKQVSTAELPELTDIYVLPELFSPDFDGNLDETFIHYQALEPIEVEIEIFDAAGRLVNRLIQPSPTAGEYLVPWDGRGLDGFVVPDGEYTVVVQGSHEYRVEIDATPIGLELEVVDPYSLRVLIDGGEFKEFANIFPILNYEVTTSRPEDVEIAEEVVERGAGASPATWDPMLRFGGERRGGELTFGEFTDATLRVRVSDFAGNRTVATAGSRVEKLMIVGFGDHAPAEVGEGFELIDSRVDAEENNTDFRASFGLVEAAWKGTVFNKLVTETGAVRFHLAETIHREVVRVVVEHRELPENPADDPPWVVTVIDEFLALETTEFISAPPQEIFELVWDELESVAGFERQVRIVGEDVQGNRFPSATFVLLKELPGSSPCQELTFRGPLTLDDRIFRTTGCVDGAGLLADVEAMLAANGLDPETQDVLWGYEAIEGDLTDLTVRMRSAEDPSYAVLTTLPILARRGNAFLLLPDPDLRTCASYTAHASAETPPEFDPTTGQLEPRELITEESFTFSCVALRAEVEIILAEDCGAPAPELATLRLSATDQTEVTPLRDLTLVRSVAGGDDEVVLSVAEPVSGLEYEIDLDLSIYPEGIEHWLARVENLDGQFRAVPIRLAIDRIPPVPEITFPTEGAVVCGFDNRFELEAVLRDETPGADVGFSVRAVSPSTGILKPLPYWGISNAEKLQLPGGGEIPLVAIDNATLELSGPLAEVVEHDGPISHQIRFWDRGGNLTCHDRSYVVDAFNPEIPIEFTFRSISPNGDDVQDRMQILYQTDEFQRLDVEIWPAKPSQLPPGCEIDGLRVRTLADDTTVFEDGFLLWDGRDDAGAVVADGGYLIAILNRDTCGNPNGRVECLGVDTIAPLVEIVAPRLDALDLPQIIAVEYNVVGAGFFEVSVGETHDPVSWQVLRDGPVIGANPHRLFWNTFGLEGDWTVRLVAVDGAGNRAETRQPVILPVRADLISTLEPEPEIFSPNGDGRREQVSLRFGLLEAADVALHVTDESGGVVRELTAERLEAGSAVRQWDGLDDSGLAVADGLYLARLEGTLVSDPNFSQEVTTGFELDATPPTVAITRPEGGFVSPGGSVLGTVTDPLLTAWEVVLAEDNQGASQWTVIGAGEVAVDEDVLAPLDELADGAYLLRVVAEDAAENRTEVIVPFIVDETPPTVAIVGPPAEAVVGAANGPLAILGSVNDEYLQAWQLEVGAGEAPSTFSALVSGGETGPGSEVLTAWELTSLADGPYVLRLSAEDKAGNRAETLHRLEVDNTPPTAVIDLPTTGSVVSAATTITGTATDAHFLDYRLEVAPAAGGAPTAWVPLRLSTTAVDASVLHDWQELPAEGAYVLRLTVADEPGNVSTAQVEITVDTEPPAPPIALTAVVENQRDGRLDWTPSPTPDVAGYRVYRGGQPLTSEPVSETTYLDAALPEGTFVYRVTAVDASGNESEPSNEAEIEIDTSAPEARIFVPSAGQRVAGLVDVTGIARATDFKEYRLSVEPLDGSVPRRLLRSSPVPAQAEVLGQWNTLGASQTLAWRLVLEAEDLLGNAASDQVVVEVDNQPPAAPTLTADLVDVRDAEVTWTASPEPDLAGYLLYRDGRLVNASGPVIDDLTPFLLDVTQFSDPDLADGTY